jgi:hypothetical protein
VSLLTELEICLVVSVSINIPPLTGLESPKLIREGGMSFSPHSYQLKGKILEIYVLNSVRSEMFIA